MLLLFGLAHAAGLDGLPSVKGTEPDAPPEILQPAGDMDGDGLGDLVIGMQYDDSNGDIAGGVWIVYGTEFPLFDGVTPLPDISAHLWGNETQDRAGADVAALGDFDFDGFDDAAVSAPEATTDQVQGGKVYLLYGGLSYADQPLEDEPAIFGAESADRIGSRVYAGGDLDGDGLTDLLIGVFYSNPAGDPGPGWLAVILGRSVRIPDETKLDTDIDATSEGTTADESMWINPTVSLGGRAAAVVPDQTGDGLPEILVGAPGVDSGLDNTGLAKNLGTIEPPGAVYVFHGRTREEMAADGVRQEDDADGIIAGNYNTSTLPWMMTTLPDGRVALGVPQANNQAGVVLLYDDVLGNHLVTDAVAEWEGASSADQAGWGLAAAHGLGGGLLAIGEPGYDSGRGRVRIVDESGNRVVLEGCAEGDLAGAYVRSSPGPDPYGEDQGWIGISAPGAGYYGEGYGYGYVVTADALDGLAEGPCRSGDTVPTIDDDGDGYGTDEDCDDTVAWRHPGAPEVCGDGVDDDCDGAADESCAPGEGGSGDCGCATPGPGGAGLGALLGLAALARRRR